MDALDAADLGHDEVELRQILDLDSKIHDSHAIVLDLDIRRRDGELHLGQHGQDVRHETGAVVADDFDRDEEHAARLFFP